jgi:hypothetical protein
MANSEEHARRWVSFLAKRPEIRNAGLLLEHFQRGQITRLCDCGCQSFELHTAVTDGLEPLVASATHAGCVFSMAFHTEEAQKTVEFGIFVDPAGYLQGIDVDYCANSFPMPESPTLLEPPFHVHGPIAA